MFEIITPEQAGISSKSVRTFVERLEKHGANTHGILFMKGDKIFAESYWSPFTADFNHRMYSETKSFVSVAIGLLVEEGKLSLDDTIVSHFPEKMDGEPQKYLDKLTIRDMLTMCTIGEPAGWFSSADEDRTHIFLNTERRSPRPSGMFFAYDSAATQTLSSLVEKLSGKRLLDYLKEKLFNKMDAFKSATILRTKNGDTWGDSALIATVRDMAKMGRFLLNYGTWNGERLMSEDYLKVATSKVIDNRESAHSGSYNKGYGYLFWRVCGNGFAMIGMGDQLTVCYPDKDLIFVYVSDNQGKSKIRRESIFENLEDLIVDEMLDGAIDENKEEYNKLEEYLSTRKLFAMQGLPDSDFRTELDGQEYICDANRMGFKKFTFRFKNETEGEFIYENDQGEKVLPFGVNHNVFGKFPQLGYSNEFGGKPTTDGFMYNDAVSLAWLEEKKLMIFVQIIDKYFGNLSMIFSFKDDFVCVRSSKAAEAFLYEYEGLMTAKKSK